MKTLNLPSTAGEFREMVRRADREPFLLTQGGKAVAAVVPIEESDAESVSLSSNPRFQAILRRSIRQADAGETFSLAEIKREFSGDKAPARKRAASRAGGKSRLAK